MDNNTEQLKVLAEVFNTDKIITSDQIEQVLTGILGLLVRFKKENESLNNDTKTQVESILESIYKEHDRILKSVENSTQNVKSEATESITKAISEMKRMCAEVMEMKPKDGEKGEDADEEKIIEEVLAKIKLPEYKEVVLDDGAEIISKINDEKVAKINASQIEGLPTFEGKPNGGGWRNLNQLHDVNLTNLANNDVLKYNSTTELWENGVGGGGATAFTDLTDAPSSYSGQAGKAVRVNVGETGLEFFTASGTGTVTSVAATVPTGLTISGSPITAAGTLAIALDTGYVIPLQTTLDGKANTALSNLASVAINTSLISDTDNTDDLGSALIGWRTGYFSTSILTPKVTADTSAGLLLESANGTDVGLLGAGNTANVEWYGSHNFDTATANTIAIFGASKTLSSGTVGNSLSFSTGTLDTIQDIRTTANPQFATIELGAATDTTLSRVSAGVIAVEGVTVATASNTLTLSGKTLTEPKFVDGGFIADANGNEMIIFDTVASAVNEITLANAATTGTPTISATGGDTNINLRLTPKGTGIVKGELKRFMVRLLASTTDTATGTTIGGDYRISNRSITVKAVGAYVDTAGTTNTTTIDINEAGTSILSTKITIDSTEKSSETAATPPVISDTSIAADAVVTFDIDAVSTTAAKGLTVWIDYVYA